MKRTPPSIQYVVGSATRASAMSTRPIFRGARSNRGYSNRPFSGGGRGHYVTGDSHNRSVQDGNLGSRQGDNNHTGHHHRPPPQFNHNNNYRRVPPPSDYNQPHQQFRPPQQKLRPVWPTQQRPQKPLDYRNWEYAKTTLPPNSEKFIVLSYNILADYLANDHRHKLYYHIPRHMMDWQWRKTNLIFEIGLWSTDIMCFQEVDRFQELQDELRLRGYSGIYKMRTGNPLDGCAVFWRSSRFKLLHEECIEFNKFGLRDNVAQICVLESLRRSSKEKNAGLPTNSTGSHKVVICNIHVLYNPRRGEIKLGQVRLLLEKAHAVSKFWNDAPIVLCGDYNCTPKSPLYNFISEQKLDLSELDRDKVSGQDSAEIGPPRSFNPSYRGQHARNFVQGSPTVEGKDTEIKLNDLTSDSQNQNNPETGSAFHVQSDGYKEFPSTPYSEGALSANMSDVTEIGYKDSMKYTSKSNDDSNVSVENESMNCTPTKDNATTLDTCDPDYADPFNCKIPLSDAIESSSLGNLGHLPSNHTPVVQQGNANYSGASTSVDPEVQKSLEFLSLTELDKAIPESENTTEDDSTFLSALHNTGDGFASFASEPPKEKLPVSPDRIEDGLSSGLDSEMVGVEQSSYDPSLWTPIEIEVATGNRECTLLEHPLKLRSTYTEVEDCTGTRDSNGEPLVTSYNRCFFGTVDYIWRSEGLQTVRVLAPIPKQAMQRTSGFPTRKWASDHIALATELVFTKSSDQS